MLTGLGTPTWKNKATHMFDSRICRWTGSTFRRFAPLLVVGLVGGLSVKAPAQTADRVFANCLLPQSIVDDLSEYLQGVGIPTPRIDFLVVYAIANENDGQAIAGGFTGPVLCRRGATGGDSPLPAVQVQSVQQTDPIPPGPGTVDLLGVETALITQYQTPSGPPNPGNVEKRFCHSVANINDCFRIFD
jgi:hypothetical protein